MIQIILEAALFLFLLLALIWDIVEGLTFLDIVGDDEDY